MCYQDFLSYHERKEYDCDQPFIYHEADRLRHFVHSLFEQSKESREHTLASFLSCIIYVYPFTDSTSLWALLAI